MCSVNRAAGKFAAAAGPGDFAVRRIPLHTIAPPAADEIHAWYLDLGKLARSLQDALDGTSGPARKARLTGGQLRFSRRFFLRLLLGAYLGVPGKSVMINRSERGKPILDQSIHSTGVHFSMAKSEDRLLIGFSSTAHLGVDLEPASRKAYDPLAVARRYFSERESNELAAMPAEELDAAFLRTWACKEAVVKASGQGIANQLCRFSVETDLALPAALVDIEDEIAAGWSLVLLEPEEGFLGAVAVRNETAGVRAFRLLPAGQTSE